MKTDYFSTFLSSLTPEAAPPARAPQHTAERAPVSIDFDQILKTLTENGGEMGLPQLAQATRHGVNDLIPAIVQLQDFGLVSFDRTAVRLTSQGKDVPLA